MIEWLLVGGLLHTGTAAPTAQPVAPSTQVFRELTVSPRAWPVQLPSAPIPLDTTRTSIMVVDPRHQQILWAQGQHTVRPMASLTKLMTVLIARRDLPLDAMVRITAEAASVGGASYQLQAGDTHTVRELITAAMVPSANDAATALATHHSGSVSAFVEEMNRTAAAWGLDSAVFYNPTGLDHWLESDDQPGQWVGNSIAPTDLVTLARLALRDDFIAQAMQLPSIQKQSTDPDTDPLTKYTTNKLLGDYGVRGLKTGYTELAGECFVGWGTGPNGEEVLTIVMGSADRFGETERLLDWVWGQL